MPIDLGRKSEGVEAVASQKKKKYYPTAYINGVKGLELKKGDTGTCSFRVTGVSDKEGQHPAYDIEITEIHETGDNSSEDGLDKALTKIQKQKIKDEADSEGEGMDEEMMEKKMGDTDDEE